MLIVKIMGGLGNQMFQYAFGRSLQLKYNCEFKLDTFSANPTPARKYTLNKFNIEEHIANNREIKSVPHSRIYTEKTLKYNKEYTEYDFGHFTGYWQSEKYFKEYKDIIKNEFQLSTESVKRFTETDLTIMKQMFDSNSCSLNIRRGDYLRNNMMRVHGVCDEKYYNKAFSIIKEQLGDVRMFVFSDDIVWCKHYMNIPFETVYVSNPCDFYKDGNAINNRDFLDLTMISKCKNHIIGNSTFAWWGAWLSENDDKLVIAPDRWFADSNLYEQSTDLIPETWLRIC